MFCFSTLLNFAASITKLYRECRAWSVAWSQIIQHKHSEWGPLQTSMSLHNSLDSPLKDLHQEPPCLFSLFLLHTLFILHTPAFVKYDGKPGGVTLTCTSSSTAEMTDHLGAFICAIKALTLFLSLPVLSFRCVWCDASGLAQGTQLQYNVDTKNQAQ